MANASPLRSAESKSSRPVGQRALVDDADRYASPKTGGKMDLSKSMNLGTPDIPLAHRGSSASNAIIGGQIFHRSQAAAAEDDKWAEENFSEDKIMLRGWLECRKKRRFAKYKKEWSPKYFILLADSLIYMDSVEDRYLRGKYPLLGAVVKTWRSYKEGAPPPPKDREYSVSKTKSVHGAESHFESPEDRTMVLITSDGQTLYVRFMTSVEMMSWYDGIEDCAKKLISKYTPAFENLGILVTLLTAGKDGDGKLSFNLEAESGELKWKFWRSYQEFEENHKNCVEKHIIKPATPPQLPAIPADDSNMKGFLDDMREYLGTLIRIEAIAHSPEFLEFAGVVQTREKIANSVALPNARHIQSWEHVMEFCQTGDVILVSNTHWMSQVQRTVTKADWDHVGMIVNIPTTSKRDLSKLNIIEATSADGVKKYPLRMRLQQMGEKCTVGFRRLEWSTRSQEKLRALQEFIDEVDGKPYSLKGLISKDSTEKFFCSQLVSEAYKVMGVISEEAKSGNFLPGDFSAASRSLPFNDGCGFDGEEAFVSFEDEPEVSKSKTVREIEESKSSRSRPAEPSKSRSGPAEPSRSKAVQSPTQKSGSVAAQGPRKSTKSPEILEEKKKR
jgi:hypothetical protein